MTDSPTLHQTLVDDVLCYWTPTGRPTLRASLSFRFGTADETLPESGWQHLVEHLCMEANPGNGGVDVNASVSLHETCFDAHGEPESVVAHLNAIVRWLREPHWDRLAHERQVLRAEAALRGGGPVLEAFSWRYGAGGPGLAGYPEPGLGRADEGGLRARIARAFNGGNGVLALDGPPPSGLRLELGTGDLLPLPRAVATDNGPAAFTSTALSVSGVVSRDGGMFIGTPLLERAIHERLRSRSGTAYAPWATYERVDADHAVVVAGSDFGPESSEQVGGAMLDVVAAMASEGPPPAWLAEEIDRTLRRMTDPFAAGAVAFRAANQYLHGKVADTFDEGLDRVRAVSVAQVAADMAHVEQSLLLGGPPEVVARLPLPVLQMPPAQPAPDSVVVRSINWPGDDSLLHLHAQRVAISGGERPLAVDLDDLGGYLVFDDGRRHLLRVDGYGLTIDPRWWAGGSEVVDFLDRRVPARLHLPQPAQELAPVRRDSLFVRWIAGAARLPTTSPVLATLIYALAMIALLFALRVSFGGSASLASAAWATITGLIISAVSVWQLGRESRRP